MCTFVKFIILLAISACLIASGHSEECSSGVNDCVNNLFAVIDSYANDYDVICRANDEFFECVANETRTCDPVVTASLKAGLSPIIEIYQNEPYSCKLASVENSAITADECSEDLAECSYLFLQAETEREYELACGLFEEYLGCMTFNTTGCQTQEMQEYISEHAANTTAKFDAAPFYCEERLSYDIDRAEYEIAFCMEILDTMNLSIQRQDYVCGIYEEFFNCAIESLATASPRQFEEYITEINAISETFRIQPYFCESEKPCLKLFESCNSSAFYPEIKPCELMDVYTVCLSNGLSVCSEDDYVEVANEVQTLMSTIHNKYNCVEGNKDVDFERLSTLPPNDDSDDDMHNSDTGAGMSNNNGVQNDMEDNSLTPSDTGNRHDVNYPTVVDDGLDGDLRILTSENDGKQVPTLKDNSEHNGSTNTGDHQNLASPDHDDGNEKTNAVNPNPEKQDASLGGEVSDPENGSGQLLSTKLFIAMSCAVTMLVLY